MRSYFVASFVLLFTLFLANSPALSQGEMGVGELNVRLCDNNGKTIATSKTSDDGAWSFAIRDAGQYSIVVDDQEFEAAREARSTRAGISSSAITFEWTMADNPSVACSIGVRSPENGMPSGEVRFAPVQFVRELDRATPMLKISSATTIRGTISYATRKDARGSRK